ncbi:unnamed protein product [Zymoseptoria tritici ST99CH_1A5]|uniref:Uncharacterized protein n=4 Tax=Zymoseptoria tritici TaxID=1047171 RepID=F9XE18_ZYMTI|nr:uncharacterized protein MYCGRDRAFT_72695 [Zymoseptoria tritici IPO323]EGP86296.1 hypothetical protein MYCGRDRAFT_72695 [Zymoseptoria tritici IPO323]SMQ51371.1 unnamed protein product [Zymoseptoria tritici ST99CH_3D7]SMR55825.1 unnamed protein product [Zymoseptoria tritici ST99CH_3D1]SMY25013.1 unnamed protein product [Zymoseptoria tritici ST99CH_1A5]
MSVTTTANARILTTADYLSDYTIHHTQPSSSSSSPAPAPNALDVPGGTTVSRGDTPNAANWETRWRRVPAHRPVQDQRDEMRTTYTSEVERNFVRVMFSGVFMVASTSQIWRATGGRLNGDIFKYKVGGEW